MDSKDREIKVLRSVLNHIIDLGYDYDGYENSLEGCKYLIDEFVDMSKNALDGKGLIYMSNGQITNIFDELIGEYDQETWELNYYDKERRDY